MSQKTPVTLCAPLVIVPPKHKPPPPPTPTPTCPHPPRYAKGLALLARADALQRAACRPQHAEREEALTRSKRAMLANLQRCTSALTPQPSMHSVELGDGHLLLIRLLEAVMRLSSEVGEDWRQVLQLAERRLLPQYKALYPQVRGKGRMLASGFFEGWGVGVGGDWLSVWRRPGNGRRACLHGRPACVPVGVVCALERMHTHVGRG